ncbi:MAG: gamma-glutamyl-gamma-aminobutyrate hydrolase family protein [candidate division KSB1 bacterium]|nr:gamma-glutamyl-gamma-aminobutyrate hydrolase family protein [candidate division KSB1 bacterium]MDZ7285678.1 gamma-glutamyl-gamma-aminobutyrate hydrolase family protein [candidate division KSB1 bacterium]MDZ7298710.1 gamma-glutamyl-gamma-aminobutyrate hydrolase family protein [candidate division KSB1 bacterium]MDZ7307541.1 gamma-glutamyl-gamma-aminobutyrate hydrolase family protein [candidate division KSB1 bacterium]MDZ7349575.1 gamma-glutamyl-gamma-aminobutyrate hydrolase family protein [can
MQRLPEQFYFRISCMYTEAIYAAGGIPVLLPLIPERDYVDHLWPLLDGLVLSGCQTDLDPRRYGEMPHPKLGPVNQARDQFDWLLLERAHADKLPVLGICRGMQTLNVFRGGTLIQDLPSQRPSPVCHARDDAPTALVHEVRLAPHSALNDDAGERRVPVNSSHHQAVRELGRGLVPIAWSADGLIEGFQNERWDEHYILGVQWHPERLWQSDEFSRKIFRDFVAEVSRRRSRERRDWGS